MDGGVSGHAWPNGLVTMNVLHPQTELRRLFTGLVEQVFYTDLGICEPALTDYLSSLLADFVHVDSIYRMQAADGGAVHEFATIQAQAEPTPDAADTVRIRTLNRYLGDFSLFWTGMYPETLRPRGPQGIDRTRQYMLQGKRGYGIASDLSRASDVPSAHLLRELSDQFEFCVRGLHLVRQSWEQLTRQPRHN